MKTVKLNAFDNPFVYGVDNKEYLVFNIDNETQTLKFQSLIGDLKVKTANILFKANSLPAKLYEMVVDDDILTFTLPSVLTGYNGSMYVYLLLNYSDDLSTSDLYTFKLADKGSSTFNFEISSICESNISTIVSEEIKNKGISKSILDIVSNYEFDKLQHAQQSLSLVENAFSSTLEKRIDLFNSAYDKANATKSNTTGDINDGDIDIPGSNTHSDLKDYVENVKKQMAERLKDVTAVSEQIQDEMTQEKQSFLGASLIFQQDLKQERDIISAYGESTRQHMDHEFNEVKDYADKVFVDFSKNIPDLDASIKQVNDKIVATDNKVGTLNTKVTNVENDITELEKMHNEVTQTINNGKPISLYSNSLEFGDYDYSGNPNLMRVIKASDFRKQGDSDVLISDVGYNSIRLTSQKVNHLWTYTETNVPSLVSGKTYTISAKVKIEEGTTGNIDQITVGYRKTNGGTELLAATGEGIVVGKEIIIKGTSTVNYEITELSRFYLDIEVTGVINGSVIVSDIKIEAGSTATPYQPNLLDEPYYLSKVPLGENIANPAKTFPIKSSAYEIYKGNTEEELMIGQTYTITLKGTKPASQTFTAYNFWNVNLGDLKPVEGLTDVWSLTFTPTKLEPGLPKDLRIFQMPKSTIGACQIDWLKIEKGNYRTPPIESYKYKGVSLRNTIDPKAFDWQEQTVTDVSKLKEQVNTLTPKVDNSQLFKLTNDNGNAIKVDYMNPKPTSFLALAKNTGFYSISTAESKLMSDYNELPALLQNTFLFINNYPPRDGFILQEITGGEISTQLVHKYYRRIEPDGTYKNWNKVITDKDASKMKTLYSNCIDFGNYDYSGNPNISLPLNSSSFSSGTGGTVSDDGDQIVFTLDGTRLTKYKVDTQTPLIQGKIYTISCEILLDSDFVGDPSNIKLQHSFLPGGTIVLQTTTVPSNTLGTWQKLQGTATINYGSGKPKQWYSVFTNIGSNTSTGHIRLRNVKIEEARIATPYQPNLLVAPYYLSKVDLGENIAPNTNLPVTTSSQLITQQTLSSYLVKGETYTVTLEGTKPENQDFSVFIADVGNTKFGDMTPVEGLTNQWELTFTYNKDTQTSGTKEVRIYQRYAELGSCTIKWLKIEKSSVATPNIKEYKYKGFSVKPSNNPNDYEWSIDRSYGEKRLDKMVNTTDPQSIDGTKNFLQVPTVKGNNVLFDEKPLPYEGWYTNGEVLTNLPDKSKLRVGPVVATIGRQYNRSMKDDPLQWNGSRYESTVLRDCTILIEGLARMQYGSGTSGQYGYLVYYRDSAQTQEIGYVGGTGGSVPNAGGTGDKLQWKLGTPFSRIMELHKGDVFNITFSTSSGAKADFVEVQTLHVMEIEPL